MPNPLSITLKSNYASPKEVMNEIERLNGEFTSKFKRAAKSSLVYSSIGLKSQEVFSLAIWPESGPIGEAEIEFFKSKVK